jgi:phage-related protein
VQLGNNIIRILGFIDESTVVLTNGFSKKTQKTPRKEIEIAERRKQEYFERKK